MVAKGRWKKLPPSVGFWSLGGPEADAPWDAYYDSWASYDAQVFFHVGRWFFTSATPGPTLNGIRVGRDKVELHSGATLGASGACDIVVYVLDEDDEVALRELLSRFAKQGIVEDEGDREGWRRKLLSLKQGPS